MLVRCRLLFLQQFDFFGSYAAIDFLQFSKTANLVLELRGHLPHCFERHADLKSACLPRLDLLSLSSEINAWGSSDFKLFDLDLKQLDFVLFGHEMFSFSVANCRAS